MSDYLSIEGIGKRYGMATALEAIDIGVSRGEFLALLGPSGCGKTTLLRIIAGLLNADGGKIVLDGLDITDLPPWKRDIGLVFQNYALFPHMSVRENVGFGLQMRKIDARAIVPLVDEALDVVRLRDYAERRPSELSGGQQQRVAIARAIAIKPRLLLLDEPLSNLDAVLRNSVRVELRELHERTGLTTIMVTHDQAEALTLADRIAVLSQGSVLQHDTAEVIYEQPQTAFVAAFVGSPPASLFRQEVPNRGDPARRRHRLVAAVRGRSSTRHLQSPCPSSGASAGVPDAGAARYAAQSAGHSPHSRIYGQRQAGACRHRRPDGSCAHDRDHDVHRTGHRRSDAGCHAAGLRPGNRVSPPHKPNE